MDFHTVTDHSRTTSPITHCTYTAVCTDHARTCKQSHNHHHPITRTHKHYINHGHSLTLCRVLLASLLTKRFPVSLVCLPMFDSCPCFLVYSLCLALWTLITSFWIIARYLGLSLCLALWILFADRRPTLAHGLFSALSLSYLFATV